MNRVASALMPVAIFVAGICSAHAQTSTESTPVNSAGTPAWTAGAKAQATGFRGLGQGAFQVLNGIDSETTPIAIPQTLTSRNTWGLSQSYLQQGAVSSPTIEPFFQALGTNGRTCATCHQTIAGWSITPSSIQKEFQVNPAAPLFTPIDGAVCPTADTSTAQATAAAYSLLLNQGLIRVFIPLPSADILQFSITAVSDPYNCTSNPATGLTSPTTGIVSQYRRPLPATNLQFMSTLMWDGREPSLASQAADAVALHAQGTTVPSTDQVAQITAFENGLFSAQSYDSQAGDLTADGAQGGPLALAGVQFVQGANAPGPNFNPDVLTAYNTWNDSQDAAQAAIARGQVVFNEKPFNITGVAGLNDVANKPSIPGTCSACHNSPQAGNHSSAELLDQGLAEAPSAIASGTNLNVSALPVFTVQCNAGPLAGTTRQVTDLGRAMITGQCADIGKFKTALLRNLAARPPYFHNGSATSLTNVVEFYNERFSIGLTDQEKSDLVAFLGSL